MLFELMYRDNSGKLSQTKKTNKQTHTNSWRKRDVFVIFFGRINALKKTKRRRTYYVLSKKYFSLGVYVYLAYILYTIIVACFEVRQNTRNVSTISYIYDSPGRVLKKKSYCFPSLNILLKHCTCIK